MNASTRWRTGTFAVLDLFLTLGLLGVYLKIALLGQQWDAVARFLGKLAPHELTLFERLGFFWQDVTLNLLVIPVVATGLVCLVFRRYRVVAALVVCMALSLVYFVELRAQQVVGQYISRDLLADLAQWGIGHPGMGRDFVTVASVVKLALLLAVFVTIAVVARWARVAEHQHAESARVYRRLLQIPAAVLVSAAVCLAIASFAFRLPNSQLNESSVRRAFAALTAGSDDSDPAMLPSYERALDASRVQTHTQPFDPIHPFVGHERGADLLIFMMETGPAQALDLAQAGRTLPGTGPLYARAFVAARHYTTHPYSSDAMYSILSGLYPQGRRRLLREVHEGRVNGLMTALQPDVPVRRMYVPSLYDIKLDDRMYAIFGADAVYVSDKEPSDPVRAIADRRAGEIIASLQASGSRFAPATAERLHRRLRADLQALERVKADITAAVGAGQRYAVMFFPEIGHAPWQALHGEEEVLARGRALMLLQDGWLKELADTIRGLGRLERTVIAVTADHGIRTRAEDPALPVGRISDYMFRVPLIVYAPQTLKETMAITTPTSHIDLAPTLTALVGKTEFAARMQGVPIWQRTTRDRLYFLAAEYGGADGFVEDGTYYMRQALSGAVYRNTAFTFADKDQVPPGAPIAGWAIGALAAAEQLQHGLVAQLLREPRR